MEDARTEPAPCPYCRYVIDAHAPLGHNQHMPEPGNLSICFKCTGVSKYNAQLKLDSMSEEELTLIKIEDPETYHSIQKAREQIRNFFAYDIIKKL